MPDRLSPLPFVVGRVLSAADKQKVSAVALAANDRYVIDFLEEHALCPYARAGRERGATERHVHFAETDAGEPISDIFERAASSQLDVVQIIFPLVSVDASGFARFVAEVTEALNARLPKPVFASAALHPGLVYRRDSPAALISLFRRAPDPTLQWVRLAALDSIYRGRKGGTSFVDLGNLGALFEANPKRDLYDEIARTNQETARRLGIDAVEKHLSELHHETQATYQRLLDEG